MTPPSAFRRFAFVVANATLSVSNAIIEWAEPTWAPMGLTLYERWRMHVEQFCMFAEMDFRDPQDGKVKRIGFSQRYMERAKICGRTTWEVYKNLLVEADVLYSDRAGTIYTTRYLDKQGRAIAWNRASLRVALNVGKVVLSPRSTADEPPFLPEPRFTVAQFPHHRFQRAAKTQPAQQAVITKQVPEIKPYTGYADQPEWIKFHADRVCRILVSHRYYGTLDVSRVIGNAEVFTVHIDKACDRKTVMSLHDEFERALGAAEVTMSFLDVANGAYVTIQAPLTSGV